jgi:hypothetical protein
MRSMPAKVMPMPALAAGERKVFLEGEAVGVLVTVAVAFVAGEVGAGFRVVVVVVKVEEDGTTERG